MPTSVPRIPHVAPVTHSVPASPLTPATVALNIASHRDELFRLNPGAVELAAECIFAFHEDINGSLTTVLASRAGSYAREQGTGKRSLTVEDICEMVTRGGSEGRSAVRALLAPIFDRLDGVTASMVGIGDAAADFDHEAGDITEAILRGKTEAEIDREMLQLEEAVRIYKRAKQRRREVSAPFAAVIGGRQ